MFDIFTYFSPSAGGETSQHNIKHLIKLQLIQLILVSFYPYCFFKLFIPADFSGARTISPS